MVLINPTIIKHARFLIRGVFGGTFLIMVSPSAKTAAIMAFSVPVTLMVSNRISAPLSPFSALAFIYPPSVITSAPNFFIQSR